MSLQTPRARTILAAIASTLAAAALLLPATASASGAFKSVLYAGLSPSKSVFTGGLNVSKRCKAKRTVQIYGASPLTPFLNVPLLGATKTSKSGSWSREVPSRNHYVLVLLPKRIGGTTCTGGVYLYEITLT